MYKKDEIKRYKSSIQKIIFNICFPTSMNFSLFRADIFSNVNFYWYLSIDKFIKSLLYIFIIYYSFYTTIVPRQIISYSDLWTSSCE